FSGWTTVTTSSGASLIIFADGHFTYTAPPTPVADSFTYVLKDPFGVESLSPATVTINVGSQVMTLGGVAIVVKHVNSAAGGTHVGTFENPFNTLPATQTADIVYVWADSSFTGQTYTLAADQALLGEGSGASYTFAADQ